MPSSMFVCSNQDSELPESVMHWLWSERRPGFHTEADVHLVKETWQVRGIYDCVFLGIQLLQSSSVPICNRESSITSQISFQDNV